MDCPRCQGLMVFETYLTTQWDYLVEQTPTVHWRCVICGEIWDPVIASNRTPSPPAVETCAIKFE